MTADAPELAPPAWQRVLDRVHVLSVLAVTGEIALEHPHEQQAADRLRQELEHTGSWSEAEQDEQAALLTPVRQWTRQAAIDALWRYEGLAVLAWWLGLHPLPSVDQQVSVGALMGAVTPYAEAVSRRTRSPHAPTDLDLLATQLLTARWRLVEYRLRPEPLDLSAFVRDARFGPLTVKGLQLVEGDLAVGGEPLSRADPHLVQLTLSTVTERRRAAGWLRGEDDSYSEVPLDT